MATTSIEWTEKTWNPVRGCSIVSPGCVNCYAMRQAHRFSGEGQPYHGLTKRTGAGPQWTGEVVCDEAKLPEPLSWRKPARVFVNSMSDLFHEAVPDAFIDRVFAVMALAPQHTFQVLTKRPERMRDYLRDPVRHHDVTMMMQDQEHGVARLLPANGRSFARWPNEWPLANVWLGVSCENQQTADERIPLLQQTPAAIRWVSAEPLLEPIELRPYLPNALWNDLPSWKEPELDWIVVGGESGAGARPFDLAWGRSIVQQCKAAGVPVFVKQLGSWPTNIARPAQVTDKERRQWCADGWTRVICEEGELFTKHPRLTDRKGGDPAEWPEDLRVREYPRVGAMA